MATEIQLPALSPTMTEGKIFKWLKKEGDSISSGEAIAEVETDKSNLEVEAFDDGVLLKIIIPEGETGKVGAPIAVIGQKGEKVGASAAPAKPAAAPAPAAPKPAPKPAAPAPEARREQPQPEERGQKPGGPAQVVPIRRAEERAPASSEDNGRLRASPLAKRMAREEGLDLAGVQGSGPSGRIVKRDVEAAMGQAGQAAAAVAKAPSPAPSARAPAPAPMFGRREPDVIPISGMRKIIGQRMAEVKPGVPHFYVTVDIEMEEAVKIREQAKAAEVKISINDLIVKAAAIALRRQPKVNVSLQGDRILHFHNLDVVIAVSIEYGFIPPV